jgi:hypothetical protein
MKDETGFETLAPQDARSGSVTADGTENPTVLTLEQAVAKPAERLSSPSSLRGPLQGQGREQENEKSSQGVTREWRSLLE